MTQHPAPFSSPIIKLVYEFLIQEERGARRILDPYAGIGKVLDMIPYSGLPTGVTLVEIEPEWADACRERALDYPFYASTRVLCGDSAVVLRRDKRTYTHIITSPDYGNRFTDGYRPNATCRSYAQSLRRAPTAGNGASFKFRNTGPHGERYKAIHTAVMGAAVNRLVPGGELIINLSDFYATLKRGAQPERQQVVRWWCDMLWSLGLVLEHAFSVETRRFRYGENRHRVDRESVLVFKKEAL